MSAANSRNRDSDSLESYASASATMWSMVHRSLVGWGKHPPALGHQSNSQPSNFTITATMVSVTKNTTPQSTLRLLTALATP